jgi:hypothetical protein
MKYIKTLVAALVATALFTTAAVAATNAPAVTVPAADKGDWTLTLAGAGTTSTKGATETSIGAELGIGHTGKLILPLEAGFRQKFSYDSAGNNSYVHQTKVYTDFTVLKLWQVELQAGANAAFSYGDIASAWTVSPEAVAKLYLKKDVWAFGRVEYPYDLTKGTWQNQLVYTLGVGLSF